MPDFDSNITKKYFAIFNATRRNPGYIKQCQILSNFVIKSQVQQSHSLGIRNLFLLMKKSVSEHTSLEASAIVLRSKSIIKVQLKTSVHRLSLSSLGLWGQSKAYPNDNLKPAYLMFALGQCKEAYREPT